MRAPILRRFLQLLGFLTLAAPALGAQRESSFMVDFRKLMQIHASEDMGQLIKKNEQPAILAVIEICQAISGGSNDQLEDEIAALNKAWKKAYDSDFVDLQYNYFALELRGTFKRHRRELIDGYLIKRRAFTSAVEAKDVGKLPSLGLDFQAFGDQFSELGDHYMASQCYRVYAVCFDDGLNGTSKADYPRACEGWGLYLQARDAIQLHDSDYVEAKVRFDKLEFDGFGDPAKGPEARAAAKAESDSSYRPKPIGASFELVDNIVAVRRPMYTADTNFQIWTTIGLAGIDSTAVLSTLEDSPTIIRTGANKAVLDLDGDGEGDVDLPLTGKITPVQIELGGDKGPWAFLAVIGGQQETFQGFRYNMAPDMNQMTLYVAAAGSLVGNVDEVRIQVIDDNMDGLYGSPPKDWGYFGLTHGFFQHDMDSVVIGESKVARPWSRLQKIGDSWFKLERSEEGVDLVATRTDIETGTLQLALKGPTPTWLVMRGTGNNDDLFFDVVNGGKKKVEVPIGTYELYAGQVSKGKKSQMAKSLVLAGPSMRNWRVDKGATTKIELGAPFGFEFKLSQNDETVVVEGKSIMITGRAGETYQRLWNCVLTPEVHMRKVGSSRGKKQKKLRPVGSTEEFEAQKYDFNTVWFPISEPIDKPQPGTDFEVQLFEKKNKLFGKITSEWRGN